MAKKFLSRNAAAGTAGEPAREQEQESEAARATLLTQEAQNRERIARALRVSGRPLPESEAEILDEAARLAGPG